MVSIILPNLNTPLNFLKARIASILQQTFMNWECIIIDGYSDNGSWECLQEMVVTDTRFRFYQRPRKGIYDAWNEGLKLVTFEYVYIAPSDDTMQPDFLEKMVAGLEQFKHCSIAHCCLEIIDSDGLKSNIKNWDSFHHLKYFNNEVNVRHIRYAPLDAIIYCNIGSVYTSFTQLLIRKKVFNTIGVFLTDQGTIADFEWCLRAAFIFNTLHIPEYLATWRVHENQATNDSMLGTAFLYEKYMFFIKQAIKTDRQTGLLDHSYSIKHLQFHYFVVAVKIELQSIKSAFQRLKLIATALLQYPLSFGLFTIKTLLGFKRESGFIFARRQIAKYNLHNNVELV